MDSPSITIEGALVNLRPNRSITYPATGNSVMSMAADALTATPTAAASKSSTNAA